MALKLNNVQLIGRITHELESKKINSDRNICNFQLAVDDNWYDSEAKKEVERTQFINCTVYGPRAEQFAKYAGKGKLIFIEGKTTGGSYQDKDGQKRHGQGIEVTDWQFAEPPKAQETAA